MCTLLTYEPINSCQMLLRSGNRAARNTQKKLEGQRLPTHEHTLTNCFRYVTHGAGNPLFQIYYSWISDSLPIAPTRNKQNCKAKPEVQGGSASGTMPVNSPSPKEKNPNLFSLAAHLHFVWHSMACQISTLIINISPALNNAWLRILGECISGAPA